ncbi:MAG: alpha/beta hydrolase [Oleiphilaceae bacterium]|nr:alpha/beta hydrolase [Oleiphilaceae bacterium]
MKKVLLSTLMVLLIAVATSPWWPTSVGHVLYEQSGMLEARLAGLEEQQVDIGEMVMSVHVQRQSDKPALVLLHGFSADKNVFNRFARHLKDDFTIVIPDLAGHGKTGFNSAWDYSAAAQAERVVKLMDKLDIAQAHIMGNSMGGFISAVFALNYPERTLSATLIDPAGVRSPQASDMEKMLAQGRNPFEIDNREQFDAFFAMTMARPPWFPDVALAAVAEQYQARKPELRAIFEGFHGKGMMDEQLHRITAPTLILWGAQDRLIHVSSAQVWAKGIANSEVHIWDDIGHMPMMEIPAESASRIKTFINKI